MARLVRGMGCTSGGNAVPSASRSSNTLYKASESSDDSDDSDALTAHEQELLQQLCGNSLVSPTPGTARISAMMPWRRRITWSRGSPRLYSLQAGRTVAASPSSTMTTSMTRCDAAGAALVNPQVSEIASRIS
jgi:hypothetical protein